MMWHPETLAIELSQLQRAAILRRRAAAAAEQLGEAFNGLETLKPETPSRGEKFLAARAAGRVTGTVPTTLSAFFANMKALGLIGTADNSPCYQVVINDSNNPQTLVALGYQIAYVKVVYFSVIRYFIIDLEGGQTVTINTQLPTGPTATAAEVLATAAGITG